MNFPSLPILLFLSPAASKTLSPHPALRRHHGRWRDRRAVRLTTALSPEDHREAQRIVAKKLNLDL